MFIGVYLITGKPEVQSPIHLEEGDSEIEVQDDSFSSADRLLSDSPLHVATSPTSVREQRDERRASLHMGSYQKALFLSPYLGSLPTPSDERKSNRASVHSPDRSPRRTSGHFLDNRRSLEAQSHREEEARSPPRRGRPDSRVDWSIIYSSGFVLARYS